MTDFKGFPKATTKFLRQLERNNEREWFAEHKPRYESDVLAPALEFIAAMQKPLTKIAPQFEAIPTRSRGSLMRVYRDTRFSKDKRPYKTNIGIQFRHRLGKDVHAPGFYVHIEAKNVFLGVGSWHPHPDALASYRDAIVEKTAAWKKVKQNRAFNSTFNLVGESLKRPPRGYPADHPLIDDLKRKDFIAVQDLPPASIHEADFAARVAAAFKAGSPLMKFLCQAIEVQY